MLEKMETKKVHEVSADSSTTTINLCSQDVVEEMEMKINYTYKDSGRQLMILDIGTPVSLAGILLDRTIPARDWIRHRADELCSMSSTIRLWTIKEIYQQILSRTSNPNHEAGW